MQDPRLREDDDVVVRITSPYDLKPFIHCGHLILKRKGPEILVSDPYWCIWSTLYIAFFSL